MNLQKILPSRYAIDNIKSDFRSQNLTVGRASKLQSMRED